ncbi:MAG: hypothetical protein IJN65_01805 [Clostridia bacterium]|nr:hypothetical protein [Clostridia bacterium]
MSNFDSLVSQAKQMSTLSNVKVGAALLCKDFSIYSAAEYKFSANNHLPAELSALSKALEEKKTKFTALAIYGKDSISADTKQILLKLSDMWVIFANSDSNKSTTLSKL